MKIWLILLIALGLTAFGQTGAPLAPELAPLAAKHQADLAAVEQQRAAALARSLPFYTSALDAEEKAALARSNLDAVAAIDKERDVVKAGLIGDLIAAPFPEKLPANLKISRAALFDSFKRIEADVLKLGQQVNADYLRALTALEPRAAGNPELARQIKAEHDAVLGNPVTQPEGEVEVVAKKGKVTNGDFTQADANDFPVGWKLVNGQYLENAAPAGETYKVMQENGSSFLHTAFEQPAKDFCVVQVVDVPHFAKEAVLTLRCRGKLSDTKQHRIAVLESLDASGKYPGGAPPIDRVVDPAWKTYSIATKLDGGKTIKQLRIHIEGSQTMYGVTGYVDFSRVELQFK